MTFGDRLAAAVAARESQIVLGLDPDPARLWPSAAAATAGAADDPGDPLQAALVQAYAAAGLPAGTAERTVAAGLPAGAAERTAAAVLPAGTAARAAVAVLGHCRALVDAAGPACVAVKPQLACFERLGAAGWLVLEAVADHARAAGLLVLADAKRGDVPVTATAYAQALLTGHPDAPGLRADAVTANPLLGRDALAPLVAATEQGAGVFLLVRTSNPGAADLLDLPLATGEPFWERLAGLADELGAPTTGESGLAAVGAVTGATAPRHLARMRELMPRTPFLLPGVGAQGGDVATLAPAFAPGRAAGLVTASRSIAEAHRTDGGAPAEAARREAERLRGVAWSLAEAG
jgi:orotidine-5'-phosphate decarboxylase